MARIQDTSQPEMAFLLGSNFNYDKPEDFFKILLLKKVTLGPSYLIRYSNKM
jgi:hypothetical protein